MEILELFGVDWKLMLAQIINFAVVVVVLWWFALKPLTKTMKERSKEITKGLDDAQKSAARLDEVEKIVNDKIKESRFDADVILNEAKKQSEANKQVDLDKAKKEVENLINKAKEQIANEKTLMVKEVKSEIGVMIVTALEKILSAGLTKDIDKKYIEKVLKDLK